MKIIDGLIYTDTMGGTDECKIVPMPHATLSDYYRVPIYKQLIPHITYTVYVGSDITRIYTEETLPSCVQAKITMANAICDNVPDDETIVTPIHLFTMGWDSHDEKYNTAWRASTSIYMVVLTKVELYGLRGEKL